MTNRAELDFDQLKLRAILRHWLGDAAGQAEITLAGGGFSAARVFRVATESTTSALRRWPQDTPASRMHELHRWLMWLAAADIPVAVPLPTITDGLHVAEVQNSLWQLEPWLPGQPAERPTSSQLQSAMEQLARLHMRSARGPATGANAEWFTIQSGVPYFVSNRLAVIEEWQTGHRAEAAFGAIINGSPPELRPLLLQVLAGFQQHADSIRRELIQLADQPIPLFPCLRDVWQAHVLYSDTAVTGWIDPAAARTDHIATDLSRLLGSWFDDDRTNWESALEHYSRVCPLSERDRKLIRACDRSAVVLNGLNWVQRAMANEIAAQQLPAVRERLQKIVRRLSSLATNVV